MQSFGLSRKLEVPAHRSTSEWGVWIKDFLVQAAETLPEEARAPFLRQLLKALLQIEGGERFSEEELRLRRERLYHLLPEALRPYFPWEVPSSLPPLQAVAPPYPHEHTPFRQYGFLATRWAEVLAALPEAQREPVGHRLVRYLLQVLRSQGTPVEETALLEHLYLLSGEKVRLTPQAAEGEGREPSGESFSRRAFKSKPKGFRHRR